MRFELPDDDPEKPDEQNPASDKPQTPPHLEPIFRSRRSATAKA